MQSESSKNLFVNVPLARGKLHYAVVHSDIPYGMLPLHVHGKLLVVWGFLTLRPLSLVTYLRSSKKCFLVFAFLRVTLFCWRAHRLLHSSLHYPPSPTLPLRSVAPTSPTLPPRLTPRKVFSLKFFERYFWPKFQEIPKKKPVPPAPPLLHTQFSGIKKLNYLLIKSTI